MPVLTVNGDKKKVACGPCIRGHRSSKCAHKDRVLIEVRKPGRPLGICPHPPGSCGCERVVINYVIPKSSECPCPPGSDSVSPPPFTTTSRVQKNRAKRSVSNLAQSTVQKVIDGDPSALAALAKFSVDNSSDASSRPESAPSSSSSTPRVDAIDTANGGQDGRERLRKFQPGPLHGWSEEWSGFVPRPTTASSLATQATSQMSDGQTPLGSCCQPQPEELSPPPASCCSKPVEPSQFQPNQQLTQPRSQPQRPTSFDAFASPDIPAMQYGDPNSMTFPGMSQDFLAYESTIGCDGMVNGEQMSIPQRLSGLYADMDHNCNCGDTCACFACATHPNNRTTTDYVRYHNDLFMRSAPVPGRIPAQFGNPQHISPFPYQQFAPISATQQVQMQIHPGFQPQFEQAFAPQGFGFGGEMQWAGSGPPTLPIHQTTTAALDQFRLADTPHTMPPPLPPGSIAGFQSIQSPNSFNTQMSQLPRRSSASIQQEQKVPREETGIPPVSPPAPFDPESPDDDTSTLSPSSFLLQQFTLPGCNDMTGTCACGDGCVCPGCLTHSGHEGPTSPDSDTTGHGILREMSEVEGFSLGDLQEAIFAQNRPG